MKHQIELSTAAVLATRKLFNYLTPTDLQDAGFDEHDQEAFGELYLEVKGTCEEIEMSQEDTP